MNIKKNRYMNVGATVLFFIFCLLLLIVSIRYFSIEITGKVKGKSISALAAQKYHYSDILTAKRGTIYDQNGNVLAEDETVYKMIAILDTKQPNHVADPEKTASKLSAYINLPEDKILSILKTKGRFQVEFGSSGNDLPPETKNKIDALKLPGIMFIGSTKRYHPNGILSSHLIGYTDSFQKDESFQQKGEMGIEEEFDKSLQGKSGTIKYNEDLWGTILPDSKAQINKPKNGEDIYLTIDNEIQISLEEAMNEVEKKYTPKNIIAIVADPKTGKILGMGQRPTFDLNTRDGINNSWQNLSVEASYEPGSVMKIFTLAAAVQQNVFDPNEKYKSGKFYVKNVPSPIRDWNSGAGWGTISYLEGLQRSSNVAFSNLLDKIGQDTFRTYLDRFHFGQPTNIGLPNETSGKILYKWPIEKYTTAFGQGTTVSAIQIIQAATAIANDGKMMKPYVVDKITDPNTGKAQSTDPKVVGKPISADTAKQVRDYLRTVVTGKYGTGSIYDLPGYDVTGKTGTAQIPGPDGKYLTGNDNYIYSFIGMAPKDDPKLIVYVAVQQPHLNNDSGSIPVQMIFNPVMKNSLEYLNIKPNNETKIENTPIQAFEVPNLINSSLKESKSKLNKNGLQAIVLGKGNTVVAQSPKKLTSLLEGEKVILKTNGDITMPDMKNWSRRDILRVSELLGLKVNLNGNGYLKGQSIPPNSIVKQGDTLTVNLAIPK